MTVPDPVAAALATPYATTACTVDYIREIAGRTVGDAGTIMRFLLSELDKAEAALAALRQRHAEAVERLEDEVAEANADAGRWAEAAGILRNSVQEAYKEGWGRGHISRTEEALFEADWLGSTAKARVG